MFLILARAGIGLALLCLPASAADHNHPAEHAEIHDQFYSSWMRPDQPNVSCCSKMDCAPAEARVVNGKWQARKVGEANWTPIPESKIETRRDSPDGRNHLCSMNGLVFCFIAGSGI